jgi:hypothetical protein
VVCSLHVKVVVDTGDSNGGIDNDALALLDLDAHLLLGNLLGNQGRNVGLEGTRSESHDENTEDKDTQGSVGLVENRGSRGSNEDDVTYFGDNDRVDDCLEATEVGVGNPGSEERADVDPESVEGGERESNLLAHAQGTRNGLITAGVQGSSGGRGPFLGDEVGVDGYGTVVGHALYKLDEGDGVDPPRNGGRHTAQGRELLVGGKRLALAGIVADIAVLEAGLALRDEVGGGTRVVESRVLALGIARAVDEGGVKASYGLGESVWDVGRSRGPTYDFVAVSNRHDGQNCDGLNSWARRGEEGARGRTKARVRVQAY